MAVLRAYMDDSGTHGDSPACVIGGVVGTATLFEQWYVETQKIFDNPQVIRPTAPRAIKDFHTVDCVHSRGEFWGWGKTDTNKFVWSLIHVMNRNGLFKVGAAVVMRDFNAIITGDVLEKVGDAYYICMKQCLIEIARFVKGHRNWGLENVSYIFEQQTKFGKRAKEIYDEIGACPKRRRYYRMGPYAEGSRHDFPPLRAADIIAYETQRQMRRSHDEPHLEFGERWGEIEKGKHRGVFLDRVALEMIAADPDAASKEEPCRKRK